MADPADQQAFGQRAGIALLLASLLFALVVGSAVFDVASWFGGDLAYHRGVAYTMQGANWQGDGPYRDLLTYYGGLYPLVLGLASKATGTTFDFVLSLASWFTALAWPFALWFLGRRIWPDRPASIGLFTLLGTTAAAFTHRGPIWVDSVLASAQNAFPLYPRDVALTLVVVAAGAALSPGRRTRVLGTGIAVGVTILFHLQIGLLTLWLLAAWAAWSAIRRRAWTPLLEVAGTAGIALLASAWWWIPRVMAAARSGGLLLGDYPGTPILRLGPETFVMAFGVVGILALLGLSVMLAGRGLPGRIAPFLVWIVAFLPLVAIDRLVAGFDLLSERRVWLLVSIPMTVVATATALLVIGRLRRPWAVAFVLAVLVLPSIPGTVATVRLARAAWAPGHAGGRVFPPAAWEPIWRDLNRRVQKDGSYDVASYDAYETWIWSFSGAHVPSLWLPGPFKLGFDPAPLTGHGHLERLHDQEAAFSGGLPAVCRFARAYGSGAIILDAEQGLLGIRDATPAAAFRVGPRERTTASIDRVVAPGTTYRDVGIRDFLALAPGATWMPGWNAPDARLLAIEAVVPEGGAGPLLAYSDGGGRHELGADLPAGPARIEVPLPSGFGPGTALVALRPVDLIRVTAFEAVRGVTPPDGPALLETDVLCGSGG